MKTIILMLLLWINVSALTLRAQPRVEPRNLYERVLCVVPMVGAGTHADPRRPLHAPLPGDRALASGAGILGFSYILSDDGQFALLELVARDRSAFRAILAEQSSDVKVFEKGRAKPEDIEQEFKKHKKDFRLDQITGVHAR